MDHIQFKSSQTAAAYVANELSGHQQEAFELHMMGCSECLNDVEAWRIIKTHMPAPAVIEAARPPFRKVWWGGWGMAASFAAAMAVSAVSGYFASSLRQPDVDSSELAVFNMPAITRASECTQLPLAANARALVLRVPGVSSERRLTVADASGKPVSSSVYTARLQRDGSWVVRFDAAYLQRESVQVVSSRTGTEDEVLGCVVATVVPPPG
jgi:putative zinc finger protein